MFLREFEIQAQTPVRDIVKMDYRTAEVFRTHGITYCCGGKWPLEIACQARGVDMEKVKEELLAASRTISMKPQVNYNDWTVSFLIDYLVNLHHAYLRKELPVLKEMLSAFVTEHIKKYPHLAEVQQLFNRLSHELMTAADREEELIFPYIKQLVHVHKHKEPYAPLLIKTLRKPVEDALQKSDDLALKLIHSLRELTDKYSTPENACLTHTVLLARLKDLDNDIAQHLFLEQKVLFPKVIAIEKEVMKSPPDVHSHTTN